MMYRKLLFLALLAFHLPALHAGEPVHVVILGDSNTWIGGDDCSKPRGWNTWFKEAFKPASCRSYARSGATWTNTKATRRNTQENTGKLGNDNVIYNQICRLQEAVDSGVQPSPQLILLAAGINDAWFLKKRPRALALSADEAFAAKDTPITARPVNKVLTLAESVRYGCELLQTAFPQARIVLLTPAPAITVTPRLLEKTCNIIEGCANKIGIGVIRLDRESDIRSDQERKAPTLTRDGIHTNEEGARRNGYLVARRVGEMMALRLNDK